MEQTSYLLHHLLSSLITGSFGPFCVKRLENLPEDEVLLILKEAKQKKKNPHSFRGVVNLSSQCKKQAS